MKVHARTGVAIWGCVIAVGLCVGCSSKFKPSPSGPGVPRISNLRIEPREVERGEQATLRFDFRDTDGDIVDVYLGLKRKVQDFTISKGLRPEVISRGRYLGQSEGTAEETITVSGERRLTPLTVEKREYTGQVEPARSPSEHGTRLYEVFVVDENGQVSNRLEAQVTVR
ncbi:MAG: hypothetical protein V3T26_06730 [candidate division NC10 bacterium]